MIEQRYDTLEGLNAPILVYADIAEAEAVVAGGILKEGNNSMVYRGVLPCVRDIICGFVEGTSGVERKFTVIGKTKAGKDILQWETEGKYVKRAMAEKGWNDLTQFQAQLDDACRNYKDSDDEKATPAPLAVDLKGREYAPRGPIKLAEKYKKTAALVITNGTVDRVNSNQLAKIGKSFAPTNDTTKMYSGSVVVKEGEPAVTYNVSDKDAEALGRLIKEYQDWKADQERGEFVG